ncbi:lipopolysaccharide biosynthesis protein [Altericista sp. CCNU0014]|uniref:lipopolysaccharide biosynthesis protein n=1 Tax=Altericista sp. CCNU0014 TaxID=3082949 RepID=UPI00384A9308
MPSLNPIPKNLFSFQSPWNRLLKGLGANVLGQVVTVFIQIVSVPLLIRSWGIEIYGEWLILVSIPMYFALSDLGFGSAAANEMTLRVVQGDRSAAATLFQSAWLLISTIAAGCLLILAAIVWWLPIAEWLNFTHIAAAPAAGIILVMSLQVFIFQQVVLTISGYQCEGNYPAGILNLHCIRLLEFAAIAIAVWFGASPLGAALAHTCATSCGAIWMSRDLHRRSPWLTYGYRHASLKALKKLSLPAIAFMGFPLASALSVQGMTLILGILLGPVAVVVFSTQRTLSRLAWQILNLINNSVKPELSIAFGRGDLEFARQLHHKACKTAFWLALLAVLGLALGGRWIIALWTNQKVIFDPQLFYIMLAIVVVNSLWNTSQAVPIALNQHQQLSLRYVLSAGIALLVAIGIAPLWGLSGAAASLLIIDLAMSVYVVKASLKILQESSVQFFRYLLTPPNPVKSARQILHR